MEIVKTRNPYLDARKKWHSQIEALISSTRIWQCVALVNLLIVLAAIAGLLYIGNQSKFIPYVIEVNKLGEPLAVKAADRASFDNLKVIQATLGSFITETRTVTPDIGLQNSFITKAFYLFRIGDPALKRFKEFIETSKPFERAKEEQVSIEIESILRRSHQSWQIDWLEIVRNREGDIQGVPKKMRALVTVYIVAHDHHQKEENLIKNPLGIYIKDFSWSQIK